MDAITIKRGDTLQFICSYKQDVTNTPPVDLSSFIMTVSIIDDGDVTVIEINSNEQSANRTISLNDLVNGTFTVTMKDTEVLVDDVYYVDFKYTTGSGIEQSSKAIKLNVKGKLV